MRGHVISKNSNLWKRLFSLTKPGIIIGNLIPTIAAFFLASGGRFEFLLIPVIFGTAFVIASGCVINNVIDRDIDKLMKRTQNRILARGEFSAKFAIFFGFIVGTLGICILYFFTGKLPAIFGLLGLFFYLVLYSLLAKRRSIYAVHIGSVSGAIPPLIGYSAVNGNIDLGGIIIFLMLVVWQMPHSFAIAIFNAKDYANAKILTVFSSCGFKYTRISMLFYVLAFSILNLSLTYFHYTGILHTINAGILGIYWTTLSIIGFKAKDHIKWAKKMFFASIAIITLSCITISLA